MRHPNFQVEVLFVRVLARGIVRHAAGNVAERDDRSVLFEHVRVMEIAQVCNDAPATTPPRPTRGTLVEVVYSQPPRPPS